MQIDWISRTDTGRVRPHNEDSILLRPDRGFAVLCDGMGGHAAGEVASRIAVETFARLVQDNAAGSPSLPAGGAPPEAMPLVAAAWGANEAVFVRSQAEAEYRGMGCTLVALMLREDGLAAFTGIGDSRLYLLRGGALRQITEDHTRIQMLQRMGVPLRRIDELQLKGVITRAVGTGPNVDIDYGITPALTGDVWILCSDGLTDELDDDAIRSIVSSAGDPKAAADRLVEAALTAGGRDNVTVAIARVIDSPARADQAPVPRPSTWTLSDAPGGDLSDDTP